MSMDIMLKILLPIQVAFLEEAKFHVYLQTLGLQSQSKTKGCTDQFKHDPSLGAKYCVALFLT